MPSSQPENKPPTCDRVFGSGAHTVKNIDGVACCTVCDIPCADHIQEVEPENQLDNEGRSLPQLNMNAGPIGRNGVIKSYENKCHTRQNLS